MNWIVFIRVAPKHEGANIYSILQIHFPICSYLHIVKAIDLDGF